METLFLILGVILGTLLTRILMSIVYCHSKGGTLIVKEGFQDGVIESINLRFTINEEEICNSKTLYFDVVHEGW